MGRDFALLTLGTAGSVAFGAGVFDVVYLANGPGRQSGRVASGIVSIVAGVALTAGGALALSMVGEDHVPGGAGNKDSTEYRAMQAARVWGTVDIGLGLVSLGLGCVTLATFRSPNHSTTTTSKPSREPISLGWMPLAGRGPGGLMLAGTF